MDATLESRPFGRTAAGEPVTLYCLRSPELEVRLLDYGAAVQSVLTRDRAGRPVDVALGYDTLEEYETHGGCLGACIGRVANRIGGGVFTLDGKTYHLAKNDGENHLHGGPSGFDKRLWQARPVEGGVCFFRLSPDGEEGYPGNLQVSVTYRVERGALTVTYDAVSDRDTLCSLTNHTYWNLNGGGSALGHILTLRADRFLENSPACLPTERILPVEGTPFDFRTPKTLGRDLERPHVQLRNCGGYDHCYCLPGSGRLERAAELLVDRTGISLTVETTSPGVQLYTANFLGPWAGKGGAIYRPRDGVCLETQGYPNAMACEGFPKPILRAGEPYHHVTVFSFSHGKEQ